MTSSQTSDLTRRDLIRRVVTAVVTASLFAVIVIGLAASPPSEADRVADLGRRLRCPVCQNEAIADSPSETARQMMEIVREKVEQGETDEMIEGFFVARYGEWVLLDPPLNARFFLLWSLPVVGFVIGIVVIARRRRRPDSDDDIETFVEVGGDELSEQAERDLAELAVQVEEHEISPDVAADLTSRYRSDQERARTAKEPSKRDKPTRFRARVWTGWALGVLAMGVVAVMVAQAAEVRGDGGSDQLEAGQRPLSEVTNEELEAVVAENPDITPMRMALADRYFDAGDYGQSLQHYLEVLKQDPEESAAWARLGWAIYELGELDLAFDYETRALEVEPSLSEAKLYLAAMYLYGYSDAEAALPLLQDVASIDDLPDEFRESVEAAIAQAESEIEE